MIVEEHAVHSHGRRVFLLYFIPWLICCFINGVFSAIIQKDLFYQFAEVAPVASILKYFAAAGGSLLGGLLADWTGRRKPLAIGLVFYGTSAALSGLSSNVPVDIVFLTMAVMNGLSWGIFLTVYTLVVWGDLSSSESCAPLYAAGFIPFYLFQGIGRLVLLQPIGVSATYVSFVNSLLILISNIPLLFAPELLVREKVEEMKLNVWIRSAKKICEDHKS